MKKEKKKQRFFCKFERFMYKLCIVIIVLLIVGVVCSETTLAQINLEIQTKKEDVLWETKTTNQNKQLGS